MFQRLTAASFSLFDLEIGDPSTISGEQKMQRPREFGFGVPFLGTGPVQVLGVGSFFLRQSNRIFSLGYRVGWNPPPTRTTFLIPVRARVSDFEEPGSWGSCRRVKDVHMQEDPVNMKT